MIDNIPGSNADEQPMFAMSGDGVDDVKIPSVFLYSREKQVLMKAITNNPDLEVNQMKLKRYRYEGKTFHITNLTFLGKHNANDWTEKTT